MKTELLLGAFFVFALIGCKKAEEPAPAQATNRAASSGNPLTAPVDYLGAVAQAKKVSEKTINLAALNNAIQQFYAIEERFPASLNELVEKRYFPSLPTAPVGMKIAYNPKTGEVRMVQGQ